MTIERPLTQAYAANSPSRPSLIGLSLCDAFRELVLDDPRIAELGKPVVHEDERHRSVFSEGQYPGWCIGHQWPLDIKMTDLAFDFVRPFIFFVPGPPLPEPSVAMRAAATAIVEKLQTLRRMLVSGENVAHGTFEKTGGFGPIHRLQWARQGLTIDVKSGDLFQEIDGKAAVQWTGLILEAPAPSDTESIREHVSREVHGAPSSAIRSHGVRKKTALQASIDAAIQDLWPGGVPFALPLQVRDQKIIDWQRSHELAVASSKTIRRHLAARSQSNH
jgi:hypothetical protein